MRAGPINVEFPAVIEARILTPDSLCYWFSWFALFWCFPDQLFTISRKGDQSEKTWWKIFEFFFLWKTRSALRGRVKVLKNHAKNARVFKLMTSFINDFLLDLPSFPPFFSFTIFFMTDFSVWLQLFLLLLSSPLTFACFFPPKKRIKLIEISEVCVRCVRLTATSTSQTATHAHTWHSNLPFFLFFCFKVAEKIGHY